MWEFISDYKVPYCKLYDNGFKRVGCIGCPMSTRKKKELELYPKYKQAYIRALDRLLQRRKERGLETKWETAQEIYDWWVSQ